MPSTHFTPGRVAMVAALALSFAVSQPAQAAYFETYTSVDGGAPLGAPDALSFNATGAPLQSVTGSALATSHGLNLHVSASDGVHWTLGPYAAAHGDLRFSVAGAGQPANVSFSFQVRGGVDLSLDTDHNVSAGYGMALSGLGADEVSAGLTDVNCLGCGGHLTSSYEKSGGVSTQPWDWTSVIQTYTLSTTVESGRQDAGLISVGAWLGVNGTLGSIDIRMTSLLLNGQAATLVDNGAAGWHITPVPEPSTWGMALAGILVAGLARRRLGTSRC
jgi:PEP-CTERM motif